MVEGLRLTRREEIDGRERTGSTLVRILVVALSLTAFSFAIAAERRRSTGSIHPDPATNTTYCVYDSDVATGYGVGAFLFLLSSQSLIMGVTKCKCFGQTLALVGIEPENAYHTKYRHVVHAQNWTCESLRKGVFIAGAVFVFFTMILNVHYYMFFTKTTSHLVAGKTTRSSSTSTVGMTGYS